MNSFLYLISALPLDVFAIFQWCPHHFSCNLGDTPGFQLHWPLSVPVSVTKSFFPSLPLFLCGSHCMSWYLVVTNFMYVKKLYCFLFNEWGPCSWTLMISLCSPLADLGKWKWVQPEDATQRQDPTCREKPSFHLLIGYLLLLLFLFSSNFISFLNL